MILSPTQDYVLVQMEKLTEMSDTIISRDNDLVRNPMARVLAVGKGAYDNDGNFFPTELLGGELVYVPLKTGFDFTVGNAECKLIRENEILYVSEETTAQ